MKKMFHQIMEFRYTSIKEAEEHIEEMIKDGWSPSMVTVYGNKYVRETGHPTHPFVVEFYKWLID